MRALIFGAILAAAATAGCYALISSSLATARDAKAATFSERFAPVLDQMKKPAGPRATAG
jgi:hypothetical protein